MKDLNNEKLEKAITETMKDLNCSVLKDLSEELMELLIDATFICPYDHEMVMPLQLGDIYLLPLFTSLNSFKEVYRDLEYRTFKFKDLSKQFKFFMQGIIINPAAMSVVIEKQLVNMVFYKIRDDEKEPVSSGYDVKVRFKNFKPNTWKDLIIPENITFMELDDILKTLWNFTGEHMSAFMISKPNMLIMDGDLSRETMMDGDYDANFTLINDFFENNDKITYWYDFTADWMFDIEIKKKIDYDKKYVTIKRFKGKYDLLDNCGGPFAYEVILEDFESEDLSNLADLNEFDMEYCQQLLKRKLYVYSDWYESPI